MSIVAIAVARVQPAAAFGPASDYADDPAYGSGWTDGTGGGTGWPGPWSFSPVSAPFTVESSTLNGDADSDGDIDTGGLSFALVAMGPGTGYAERDFSPVLQVGERVAFDLDAVGSSVDAHFYVECDLFDYVNPTAPVRRWGFQVSGDQADYLLLDAAGTTDLGIPVTAEGVHVDVDLTSTTTYAARITPRGGPRSTFTGTLASTGDVDAFLCAIGGGGGGSNVTYKGYFNSVVVPEPGAAASALVALAALALIGPRKRA